MAQDKEDKKMGNQRDMTGEEKLLHIMDNSDDQTKITAEEKLLHVIENNKNKDKNVNKENNETIPLLSDEKIKNKTGSAPNTIEPQKKHPFSFFKLPDLSGFSLKNISFKKITLSMINKALIVIAVIATVLFAFYVIREKNSISRDMAKIRSMNMPKGSMPITLNKENMPSKSDYAAKTQINNPFRLLPEAKKIDLTENVEKPMALRLVGILWADKAQVIIEDTNSGKTFIVSEGDPVGKYKVVKITQNEVRLSLNGKEKILK